MNIIEDINKSKIKFFKFTSFLIKIGDYQNLIEKYSI